MTKKFTENIFILLILNLLVKPFWIFAIDRTIQNKVGADEYGLYFSLFSFSLLFNIIADFGITNYNNRKISRDNHLITQQFGSVVPVKFTLGLLYAAFTLVAALLVNYSVKQIYLLIWLIFNQILISITQYLRSNISGLQLFKTDSLISVSDKTLLIIICSYLLWWPGINTFKIEWLIYSQTIAYTISLLIALIVVIKKTGRVNFKLNFDHAISLLKRSFPFALLVFLMVFYTRIDAVMLERMLPDGKLQAGIYAQAFRILDAFSMFAFLFASILLPLFSKMIKDKAVINETLGHSFALLLIPSLGLLAAIFFNSEEFMCLLYHEHVELSSKVLQMLMIGFIGICASYIFGTLLTAAGRLKSLNQIAIGAVILNILLNVLLIPHYGVAGAAFSSMLTQVLMGVVQGIISIIQFKVRILPVTLLKYFVLTVVLFVLSLIINRTINIWYINFVIICVLSFIIGFVFKILKIKNFKNLFMNKN